MRDPASTKPLTFFFLVLPHGISSGFVSITLPFVLTRDGFSVATAASIVAIGVSAIVLFLMLRWVDAYGDPRHWHLAGESRAPTAFRFINTTKYPASLDFLLMTLGPAILLMPLAERARGKIGEIIAVFGKVPLFYYLLHIPTIHFAAVLISGARDGKVNPWLFANHPMMSPPPPPGYAWPLWLLYAVFFVVISVLYWPSRWYARRKAANRAAWMKYI